MMELLPFLACGVLLLGVMSAWAIREYRKPGSKSQNCPAEEQLTALHSDILRSNALAQKIFSMEDWEFVSRGQAPSIQRLLEAQRRAVAILWLKRTREQVTNVMRLHRAMVRSSANLSVTSEVRLSVEYWLFFPTYYLLLSLLWLRGSFHRRRVVRYSVGRIANVFRLLENGLNPGTWKVGVPNYIEDRDR